MADCWVGGHRREKEGAAPETPMVEEPPVRKSRRIKGENPSFLDATPGSAAVKKLSLGGMAGRAGGDKTTWHFHPATPQGENAPEQSTTVETDDGQREERFRVVDLNKLEDAIAMMDCKCDSTSQLSGFAEYCTKNDPTISQEKMAELLEGWKHENHLKIKMNDNLTITEKKLGFATSFTMGCSKCNEKQEVRSQQSKKFTGTNYSGKLSQQENCSWHETNMKLVLASIATGIGPSDMATFLSFLDLPISKSFPSQTFQRIENLIGKSIIKIGKESMDEALLEEIEAETGLNKDEWEKTINSSIGLNASYDMGWSKRSSGHRFDSISGHAFLIGCMCKKVIATQIASKKCSFCDSSAAKGNAIEPHDCTLNHDGSSKAMEAEGLLQILMRLNDKHEGKVHIKAVVSDDDTTMKSVIRHESSVAKKGRLPADIPEPIWLADPGHRIKVVAGKIYALANSNKSQSTCTNLDATRFKMNFGYMLKRNRNKTLEDISKGSK